MKSQRFTKTLSVCGAAATVALGSFAFATPASAATSAPEGPKNVILLIGDGMGYNHLDNMNAYENGEVYWQVDRGGDNKVKPWGGNSTPTEGFQAWDQVSMETAWYEQDPYDTQAAWGDFEQVKDNPTDSAAAGTAMATGHKTYNAGIGVDYNENVVENVSERAHELGTVLARDPRGFLVAQHESQRLRGHRRRAGQQRVHGRRHGRRPPVLQRRPPADRNG
jgi:alkaline phosphatase